MNYDQERGGLSHTREVESLRLTLKAESIRQERTGVHAKLSVLANGVTLAWSNFNVERDEERVRLANSAHKHLNGFTPKDYSAGALKKDVDDFVRGLWDAYTSTDSAELVPGLTEYEPPSFLLEPYIVEGGGTLLYAPPGRGKSWTLMLMAVSVDSGSNMVWPVKQKPVLFINLERSRRSVQNRLGLVNRVLGLPPDRPLAMMNARGRSLSDIYGAAEKSVEKFGAECVALDSISRAGAGDLKENVPTNRIMDLMNGLAPSWIGIGHTPRDDEGHIYGSTFFEAAADVMLPMLSQHVDDRIGIGLKINKENDIGVRPMERIALEFRPEEGLVGVRPARPNEFPELTEAAVSKDSASRPDLVIRYLKQVGDATATEISNAIGLNRSNLYDMLGKDARFRLTRKVGRAVYYGVAPQPDEMPF